MSSKDDHDEGHRRLLKLGKERVEDVSGSDFPAHLPGNMKKWSFTKFKSGLCVEINELSRSTIEFDLVGVDACVANAFRRIVIAEVPTIAVESVYIFNNTSLVQDEVLAQRLGLVPLAIDPHKLDFKSAPDAAPTDMDTIVFNFVAECLRRPDAVRDQYDPTKIMDNVEVYSSKFEYDEKGTQAARFSAHEKPRPAENEILIAKLRGGQSIVAELHCIKGEGKDHAKWSPVATASYRLLPSIIITKPIPNGLLVKFQNCFSYGVVDISSGTAEVVKARKDTVSREVLRHPEFSDMVELGRVKDHFIFNIESAGQYLPEALMLEAGNVLLRKLRVIKKHLPTYSHVRVASNSISS